jgi:transposase
MTGTFWLNEGQWARLAPLLPDDTRGVPRVDDRRVISGIIHVLQSGCRWRDAPVVYGPYKTLYNRFVRWARKGIWEELFQALAEAAGPPSALLLDSTYVKAHRSAAGAKKGAIKRSAVPAAAAPASFTSRPTRMADPAG